MKTKDFGPFNSSGFHTPILKEDTDEQFAVQILVLPNGTVLRLF